jgi:hypothetical protein
MNCLESQQHTPPREKASDPMLDAKITYLIDKKRHSRILPV